jgi:CRP-like cAMP-binding protein
MRNKELKEDTNPPHRTDKGLSGDVLGCGDLKSLLGQCILFKGLNSSQLMKIAKESSIKAVSHNKRIMLEGLHGDDFYILIDGSLEVEIDGLSIKKLNPFDFFGEAAFLEEDSMIGRSASIFCSGQSKVLKFRRVDLLNLFRSCRDIEAVFFKNLSKALYYRLRESNASLIESKRALKS